MVPPVDMTAGAARSAPWGDGEWATDRLVRRSRGADGHHPCAVGQRGRGDEAGEILLIRRTDNGNWAVPGGAIEFREPPFWRRRMTVASSALTSWERDG